MRSRVLGKGTLQSTTVCLQRVCVVSSAPGLIAAAIREPGFVLPNSKKEMLST